jgi:hypothetical protein
MTQEEIIKCNEVIRNFMGEVNPKKWGEFFVEEKGYHNSWDNLMSVIDKIQKIGEDDFESDENYHIFISKRFIRVIYDWAGYSVFDVKNCNQEDRLRYLESKSEYSFDSFIVSGYTKIETCCLAVTHFLIWYELKS